MNPISKGKPVKEFMALMENAIEIRSDELMTEVGFKQ
jgi:hypothetical protein